MEILKRVLMVVLILLASTMTAYFAKQFYDDVKPEELPTYDEILPRSYR